MSRGCVRCAFAAAVFALCVTQRLPANSEIQPEPIPTASYNLSVSLDTVHHRLSATGIIEFTNRSQASLSELWFHLYPNAFSSDRTLFFRRSAGARRSNRGTLYDPGSLEIRQLSVGSTNGIDLWAHADATTPGDTDDKTDRRVPLPVPLEPGETLQLFVKFDTQLPYLIERMGWVEDFLSVTQWFPKLARLENDGAWRHFPYDPLSEFSADFGDYEIAIDAPESFIIAAAGDRAELTKREGRTTTRFRLKGVHDFAFFAWNHFKRFERSLNGTRVQVYAPPGHELNVETELSLVEFGLNRFQNQFGLYPYHELIIVHPPDVAAPAGGMEYPGLIVTGGPWYSTLIGSRSLQAVTLHELAHQWFYGIIANDEAQYPALDEGLATWAELESLTAIYGSGSGFSGLGVALSATSLTSAISSLESDHGPLARPASSYKDFSTLSATVYAKTATLLETLGNVYGRDKLLQSLRKYATTQRFRHPTPDALVAAIRAELGQDAAGNVETAFFTDGWVDYNVSQLGVHQDGPQAFTSTVTLERTGTLQFPVEVELRLTSGELLHRTWQANDSVVHWRFSGPFPVRSVVIDPWGKISIERVRENNAKASARPALPATLLERLLYATDVLLSGVLP